VCADEKAYLTELQIELLHKYGNRSIPLNQIDHSENALKNTDDTTVDVKTEAENKQVKI
jgi:hypothetical protein